MAVPLGDGRTTCDGCSREASLVISDVNTREVEILCWPCLMGRALAVATEVANSVDGPAAGDGAAGGGQVAADEATALGQAFAGG